MPKNRTEIPAEMAAQVLFDSDRTCCVCRKRKPIQLHHIDDDPANHAHENLAVLCFDCHRETQIRGGFDRKLDAHQIRLYRADWLATVARLRDPDADWRDPAAGSADVTPPPNVRAILPWHTRVRLGECGVAVEDPTGPLAALIAPFRNDPTRDHPHVGAVSHLVATVTLRAAPDFPVTGHWLASSSPYVNIAPGEQRLLVVAVIGQKLGSLLSDLRNASVGEVELKHFWTGPSTVNQTELTVSLSNDGKLLVTQQYLIKLSPFPDIRLA